MPPIDTAFRERNRSPIEELQLRLPAISSPTKLPDHVRATLLHHTRFVTVDGDGVIRFQMLDRKYEFYSPNALTCHNDRGKRILITFSYDDLTAVYVLGLDKRFIEPVPAKGRVQWFDHAAAGREIRDQERQLAAARIQLEALHADDTAARVEAGRRNLERLDLISKAHIVNTFPAQRGAPHNADLQPAAEISDAQAESHSDGVPAPAPHGSRDFTADADGGGGDLRPAHDCTPQVAPGQGDSSLASAHETKRPPNFPLAESLAGARRSVARAREQQRSQHRRATQAAARLISNDVEPQLRARRAGQRGIAILLARVHEGDNHSDNGNGGDGDGTAD